MTPRKSWLLGSAAVAVAVYALMWIGYISQWNWLTTLDSSALEPCTAMASHARGG